MCRAGSRSGQQFRMKRVELGERDWTDYIEGAGAAGGPSGCPSLSEEERCPTEGSDGETGISSEFGEGGN